MRKKHVIIPIFVPHRGCPNDCIFCNQKKISGQIEEMTPDKIHETVDAHLATAGEDAFVEIAFYGGSFTAIEMEQQEEFLRHAFSYVKAGKVSEIRVSTRPDRIDREILGLLKLYGVRTIELGVQSLDDDVLRASLRGHDSAVVFRAARLIKDAGFRLGIQIMTGLPGDTREKCLETARKVISMKPDLVRIYPVLVIKGTGLEKLMEKGEYMPQSLEEAVDLCAELLRLFEDNGINVIRVGLQPTENIREGSGSDVVAGPVHPAFRQLAQSRVSLKRIEEMIESQNLSGAQELIIRTGNSNVSDVVGQKRSNIRALKDKYGFMAVRVAADPELSGEIICHAISSTTTSTVASSTGTQQ
ncbi:MAG TPA: radical SAM protein [Clostridiales bacterium]|mgnify:FL=1|nr:radical SAM protein [Clostridiales bacterium]